MLNCFAVSHKYSSSYRRIFFLPGKSAVSLSNDKNEFILETPYCFLSHLLLPVALSFSSESVLYFSSIPG